MSTNDSKRPQEVEILYADDTPTDAAVILRALRKANAAQRIVWVKDGVEALEVLRHTRPKLVLLDLKMPKVDGLEVLRQIRGDERLQGLPVVMLTSSAEESDIARSYALGVNSYVVKPIDFHQLSEQMGRLGHYWVELNRVPYSA